MAGASSDARRGDLHRAAARRVQVADAGGDGGEAVQRLAEGVERERLHVVLEVGPGLVGRRARERAELRRRHAHRAAARAARIRARSSPCRRPSWPSVLSVVAPLTANTARICRWSCRLRADAGQVVRAPRCRGAAAASPGPMPESCRICGEPIAPAASTTSRAARTCCRPAPSRPRRRCSAGGRRAPARTAAASPARRSTPSGWRGRAAGRRKAFAVFQRQPRRWLTSK